MKTVSLVVLGSAYLTAPLDLTSLAVVAAGFALNGLAAAALGSDRTCYGYEVGALAPREITAFPYPVIAHPMPVGNITAFGGTMINADFRAGWWPLAGAHVALNAGLLVMELVVTPQRRHACGPSTGADTGRAPDLSLWMACCVAAAGAVLGAAVSSWSTWSNRNPLAAFMGGCIATHAYVLYRCYSSPAHPPDGRREIQMETPR